MDPQTRKTFDEAVACKNRGDLPQAREILQSLAERNPESGVVHAILGDVFWDMEDLAGAVPCFRRATEIKPFNETFSVALFLCLLKSKHLDEALEEAKRFLAHSDSASYREMIQEMHDKWVAGTEFDHTVSSEEDPEDGDLALS